MIFCIPFRATSIHPIAWMNSKQQKQNGKRKPVNIYIRWENCQIHALPPNDVKSDGKGKAMRKRIVPKSKWKMKRNNIGIVGISKDDVHHLFLCLLLANKWEFSRTKMGLQRHQIMPEIYRIQKNRTRRETIPHTHKARLQHRDGEHTVGLPFQQL